MTRKKLLPVAVLCILLLLFSSCNKENVRENGPELQDVSLKDGSVLYTLWSCEGIDVGSVTISQNFSTIKVKFETTGSWRLEATHVHAAYDWHDIPQNTYGDPDIYSFNYQNSHYPIVQNFSLILNEDFFGRFYIACSAWLINQVDCQYAAWAKGTPFPGSSCGRYVYFYPYNDKNPQLGPDPD